VAAFVLQPQFGWALDYGHWSWHVLGAVLFRSLVLTPVSGWGWQAQRLRQRARDTGAASCRQLPPAAASPRSTTQPAAVPSPLPSLQGASAAAGYAASLNLFYAFVAAVGATLVGCAYVALSFIKNGAFPHNTRWAGAVLRESQQGARGRQAAGLRPTHGLLWHRLKTALSFLFLTFLPHSFTRLLRAGCGVLYGAAYVGVLTVLAAPMNCRLLEEGPGRLHLLDFPDKGVRADDGGRVARLWGICFVCWRRAVPGLPASWRHGLPSSAACAPGSSQAHRRPPPPRAAPRSLLHDAPPAARRGVARRHRACRRAGRGVRSVRGKPQRRQPPPARGGAQRGGGQGVALQDGHGAGGHAADGAQVHVARGLCNAG
jgi:hypothetical protein